MGIDLISAPALSFRAKSRNCRSLTGTTIHQSKLLSFIYFGYLQVPSCFFIFKIPYKLRDLSRGRTSICSPRCQPVVNSCWDTGPHGEIHWAGHAIPAAAICAQGSLKGWKSTWSTALQSALWDADQPSCSRDKGTWIKQLNIRRGTGEALIHVLI